MKKFEQAPLRLSRTATSKLREALAFDKSIVRPKFVHQFCDDGIDTSNLTFQLGVHATGIDPDPVRIAAAKARPLASTGAVQHFF